jgi:hypothetical protein
LSLPNLVPFFQVLITELTNLCLKRFLPKTVFVIVNEFNELEENESIRKGSSYTSQFFKSVVEANEVLLEGSTR